MRRNQRLCRRGRRGLSELIASVLTIAITIMTGFAVFSYANGQARISENAYGSGISSTVNYLQEKFVVADVVFASSSVTIWLYNIGQTNLQVQQIRITNVSGTINLLYNYTVSGGTKTNQVYDLLSSSSNKCKQASSSLESPTMTSINTLKTNTVTIQLTIPGSQAGCPSYGRTLAHGTYSITVLGAQGNSVLYSQKMG